MPRSVGRIGIDGVGTTLATSKPPAGGLLMVPPLAPNVFVNGSPIATVTTLITPHKTGPHAAAPKIVTGSPNVFAGPQRLPVASTGDISTCGDILWSTSNVYVN